MKFNISATTQLLIGFNSVINQLCILVYKHDQPLPVQVREPAEVICDDMVILTSWTCHYHNTFMVSLLGYLLHGPGRANLHK